MSIYLEIFNYEANGCLLTVVYLSVYLYFNKYNLILIKDSRINI